MVDGDCAGQATPGGVQEAGEGGEPNDPGVNIAAESGSDTGVEAGAGLGVQGVTAWQHGAGIKNTLTQFKHGDAQREQRADSRSSSCTSLGCALLPESLGAKLLALHEHELLSASS